MLLCFLKEKAYISENGYLPPLHSEFYESGVLLESASHSYDSGREDTRCQDKNYVFQSKTTHGVFALTIDSNQQSSCVNRDEPYAPTFDALVIAGQIAIQEG